MEVFAPSNTYEDHSITARSTRHETNYDGQGHQQLVDQ